MQLDTKYALIKLHELSMVRDRTTRTNILAALRLLEAQDILDYGHDKNGFFVLRLRDEFTHPALMAYADAARPYNAEYADAVFDLSVQSFHHPDRRVPD